MESQKARIEADADKDRRKRVPNKGSFQKGESGNLKGRPRGAKGAKVMVRNILSARTNVQIGRGEKRVVIFEALVRKEVSLAAEGDWRARRTVFELGKWALSEGSQLPLEAVSTSPEELTDTGQAILDWFADEVRAQELTARDDQ